MSSVFADQALFQFVANVTRGSNSTLEALPNGAIAVVNESNTIETSAISSTPTKKVRIVQKGLDGGIYQSPWFTYADIVAKNRTNYSAPAEQVSFLGSDGTTISGLGTPTVDNSYIVDITLEHLAPELNNSPMVKSIATKATAATQQNVANGLLDSAIRVINRGLPYPAIRTERIADGDTDTGAAFTGSATVLKFTKNSKQVSVFIKAAAGDTSLTASTLTVAKDDLVTVPSSNGRSFTFTALILGTGAGRHVVYIGETAYDVADAGSADQNAAAIVTAINAGTQATASAASAVVTVTYNKDYFGLPPMVLSSADDSTFAVVAVTTASGESTAVKYAVAAAGTTVATFNLDYPWQGETGYVYSTTIDSAAKSTYLAGKYTIGANPKWGLKFTGLPQYFNATVGRYKKVRFSLQPKTNSYALINQYTGSAYPTSQFFDSSVVYATTQAAKEGSGVGEQVAEREALAQWQNKSLMIQAIPPTKYTREVYNNYTYDIVTLDIKEELNTEMVGANAGTGATIQIAVKSNLDTNDADVLGTVFAIS